MIRSCSRTALALVVVLLTGFAGDALAGGGWVPDPGDGYASLGYSRKTAHQSWNANGLPFDNVSGSPPVAAHHDFRYGYLSGEAGVVRNVSVLWLMTYLDGFEGPHGNMERNRGLSDAWFGAKYAVRRGGWPVAVGATVRTPFFYDVIGPYTRHLYNDDGEEVSLSPEWRGILKHDLTLYGAVSRSIAGGRGWASFDAGYRFRQGAPADEFPMNADLGYPLPVSFANTRFKLGVNFVHSLGNETPREPDDRFGGNATFSFNDASMLRVAGSFVADVTGPLTAEVGYAQWVWGNSARRYKEPFFALGYNY
jgi:hypothetical protein